MAKVVIITTNFPHLICGIGDYSWELYRRLKEDGTDVKVITKSDKAIEIFITEEKLGNDVYAEIKVWNHKSISIINKIIRKEKPDWCIVQYNPYGFNEKGLPFYFIYLILLIRFNRIRVLTFFHEIAIRKWGKGISAFFIGIMQQFITYCIYIINNVSLTSNKFYQTFFYPFPIKVLYVPANLILKNDRLSSIQSSFAGKRAFSVVSFSNRCNKTMFEAFACCINSGLDIRLSVIGKTTVNETQIQNKLIAFYGLESYIDRYENSNKESLINVLNTADLYIQMEPVDAKGRGGVGSKSGSLAAAFVAGLPILATKGDMTDISLYKEQENIVFADYNNVASITEWIIKLYNNVDLCKKLRVNAKKTYDDLFSWNNTLNEYKKIIL